MIFLQNIERVVLYFHANFSTENSGKTKKETSFILPKEEKDSQETEKEDTEESSVTTAEELVKNDPSVIQSMEHNVFVHELGSSSVVLGVRAWVKTEEYWNTRWRMLENIKLTLDENQIDIPYQQITVHQGQAEPEK